jgi:hypothetical protein
MLWRLFVTPVTPIEIENDKRFALLADPVALLVLRFANCHQKLENMNI